MAVARVFQARIKATVQGQTYRNVIHFGSDVAGDDIPTHLAALALAIFECISTVLLPILPNTTRFEAVGVKQIYPDVTEEIDDVSLAADGDAVQHSLPSFVSMMVKLQTGTGGRKWKGRFFLPPPREGDSEGSLMDDVSFGVLVNFAACLAGKFIAPGATTPYRIGVLSRVAGAGTIADKFKEATQIVPVKVLAVQRRRKLGVGS